MEVWLARVKANPPDQSLKEPRTSTAVRIRIEFTVVDARAEIDLERNGHGESCQRADKYQQGKKFEFH